MQKLPKKLPLLEAGAVHWNLINKD